MRPGKYSCGLMKDIRRQVANQLAVTSGERYGDKESMLGAKCWDSALY